MQNHIYIFFHSKHCRCHDKWRKMFVQPLARVHIFIRDVSLTLFQMFQNLKNRYKKVSKNEGIWGDRFSILFILRKGAENQSFLTCWGESFSPSMEKVGYRLAKVSTLWWTENWSSVLGRYLWWFCSIVLSNSPKMLFCLIGQISCFCDEKTAKIKGLWSIYVSQGWLLIVAISERL